MYIDINIYTYIYLERKVKWIKTIITSINKKSLFICKQNYDIKGISWWGLKYFFLAYLSRCEIERENLSLAFWVLFLSWVCLFNLGWSWWSVSKYASAQNGVILNVDVCIRVELSCFLFLFFWTENIIYCFRDINHIVQSQP